MWQLGAQISAGFVIFLGAIAVVAPLKVAHKLNLDALDNRAAGKTELRATLGGLFLFVGVFALYMNDPLSYATLGAGWLGAGVIRTLAMFPDETVNRLTFLSLAIELFVAFWLFMPWIEGKI